MSKNQSETKEVKMATKGKSKGGEKQQQSLSLGRETVEELEREAERRGLNKSQLADLLLNGQLTQSAEKPTIISIMSYKGGVAKTTTCTCLAVCLSEMGYKVLVIDMDGQGNVSQSLRVYDPRSEEACIADVLYQTTPNGQRKSLRDVMKPTDYNNVFCVPSNFRFADADTRLKAEIAAKKIDVVVTMRAATIARNWGQFMEFMLICSKKNVDVVCIDKVEDAQAIFRRIQEFQKRFFEGSDVTCE